MKKQIALIVAFLSMFGVIFAQTTKLDLSLKNVTLKECFAAIEKKCDYTFMYDNSIDVNQRVSVDAKQENITAVLRKVFEHTNIRYEIVGKQIVLKEESSSHQTSVSGNVTDAQKNPLIGATVTIKGTSRGSITDVDGRFSLSNVQKNAILHVSYIGYTVKDVPVTSSSVNIVLQEDTKQIEEVVVMGYGVQKKKLVTGATVSLKGEDLQKLNTTNALQAMQGQTAGVNITSTSGQPGGGIKVNVRGVGTIGNSNPTYVVDGVITGDITYLNNADIAAIDVLKDAASCAIYGVNGANGVVLITTRGGSLGAGGATKGQISFDSYYGIQNVASKANLLNAREYATIINEAAVNSGGSPYFTQNQIAAMGSGTNWMNEMFSKNVPTQNYNIAANGGNQTSIYSLAFSYTQQGGILGGCDLSNYQRYNFRANTEHKMYGNFLKLGEHITYSHINQKGIRDAGIFSNTLRAALQVSPFLLNQKDASGNYLSSATSAAYNGYYNGSWYNVESNPYASMIYNNQNETKSDKLLGDVYAEIQPIKNLKIKSTFGLEYTGSSLHSYLPIYSLSAYDYNTAERITQNSTKGYTWNLDNTINYIFKLNKHTFDVLVGNSLRKYQGSYINGVNQGTTLFGDLTHAYLSNSTTTSVASSSTPQIITNSMNLTGNAYSVVAHASFFGRINYNYNETYMATMVFRTDGSTYFAKGNQWGYFPSVSAGWVVSNEKWMEPTNKWMDFLKLRASWGSNGNDNISSAFAYQSLITLSNATYNIGGTDVAGSYPSTIGTSNLKWETSKQLDFGLDARFFSGKLNANFDWYRKTTNNWLVQAPVYGTTGVSSAPYINGGSVTNSGIEIQLSYNNKIGKNFKYTVTGTYTYNKNNVTDIPTSDGIIHGGTQILYNTSTEFYRAQSGHAIGYFWGYKTAGVFQNESQIKAYTNNKGIELQPNAKPGDVIYVDINGDGSINASDKTDIGDPNPHHLFGASFSCSYKNFDFAVNASGVAGNKIVQSYRELTNHYTNWTNAILGRWHGEGTSNSMPRVTEDNSNWTNFSDLYIHNGAYLRLSNITLGYDFTNLIKCKYISQCRLYLSAENLFTLTKYNGMDPEVGFSAQGSNSVYNFGQGVDIGFYPRPQTYLIGLNVKF
ncbi:MAG: TonB-dependent receptor [Bacteroidetes bacterium]|nr:TonB-dependent receptor [Bacteroidota bacterium]